MTPSMQPERRERLAQTIGDKAVVLADENPPRSPVIARRDEAGIGIGYRAWVYRLAHDAALAALSQTPEPEQSVEADEKKPNNDKSKPEQPGFRCRFCGAEAAYICLMDKGCACYPDDRVQLLCPQHAQESEPLGSFESRLIAEPEQSRGTGCSECDHTGITPMNRMTGGMSCEFCSDVAVLGPEIFVSDDRKVICWQGVNYVQQPEPEQPREDGLREVLTRIADPHSHPSADILKAWARAALSDPSPKDAG